MNKYMIAHGVLYEADDLYHWGIKGMKWGIRRYQNKDGSLTAAGEKRERERRARAETKYARLGNKLQSKNGDVLTRQIGKRDDPIARKKRIDADMREADERVKFYGSKRAAKVAIKDEADFQKSQNKAKAFMNTLKAGGYGGLAGSVLGTIAADSAASSILGATAAEFATGAIAGATVIGGPAALAVGLVGAAAVKKANSFIDKHANDQLLYTDDSEYGHDIVVALKRRD